MMILSICSMAVCAIAIVLAVRTYLESKKMACRQRETDHFQNY